MAERILVCVAWPYANGPLHLGHVAGAYLPADIFARYHRLAGNEVVMVSGSDQHGTPITVRAEQEGTEPAEVAARYHQQFLESWQKLGISWDLFTRTGTENHARVVHDIFLRLLEQNLIYLDTMQATYCPTDKRFLPDRYVEGTCPYCEYSSARGDQCDNCGRPLNPTDLIDARCKFCGTRPEVRETQHYFLRLSVLQEPLREWVDTQAREAGWRANVRNFTYQWLTEGLKDRAITRDIEWGVSVPVPGFEHKRIYVWFEAVIGYLAATKEWAGLQGDPERWRQFWEEPCRAYYFIGKDNIPFHTIIWPAMLMGYGGLNLPYDVPANEHLTLEGRPFSTSRDWAVWLPDYLERFAPDPLRFLLSINMPESADADFSWGEFVRRNNDELVATYGNLAHRVLTFTGRNFEQQVPQPRQLDARDERMLNLARDAFARVGQAVARCRFKDAVREAMALAQAGNRYLDETEPWKTIKVDRERAGTSLYVALQVINALKVLFFPFLPFSSVQLHGQLGFHGGEDGLRRRGWSFYEVPPGQALPTPHPLFTKLDDAVVEAERQRLAVEPSLPE